LADTGKIEVDVFPANPWAQTSAAGEPHVDTYDERTPEHLDDGHGHKSEIARCGKRRVRVLEVTSERKASMEEMNQGEG
jgi:hypothetical protein